jgi:hypothetical protein
LWELDRFVGLHFLLLGLVAAVVVVLHRSEVAVAVDYVRHALLFAVHRLLYLHVFLLQ